MEFAKAKSLPLNTELVFGDDDVLHLQLDRDIVTEAFLVEMDEKGRRLFKNQMAGIRRDLINQGLLPQPEGELAAELRTDAESQPEAALDAESSQSPRRTGKAGKRSTKRKALGKPPTPEDTHRVAEMVVKHFEKMLPEEADSIPLAQAEEMAYMAETLARVILSWDMTINNAPAPIFSNCSASNCTHQGQCCNDEKNQCRHASAFIHSWSHTLLAKMFRFCCFEAHEIEAKKNAT